MMVCTLQALFYRHKRVRIAVVIAVCNAAVKLLAGFSTPALAKANVTSAVHEETVDLKVMTFNIWLGEALCLSIKPPRRSGQPGPISSASRSQVAILTRLRKSSVFIMPKAITS